MWHFVCHVSMFVVYLTSCFVRYCGSNTYCLLGQKFALFYLFITYTATSLNHKTSWCCEICLTICQLTTARKLFENSVNTTFCICIIALITHFWVFVATLVLHWSSLCHQVMIVRPPHFCLISMYLSTYSVGQKSSPLLKLFAVLSLLLKMFS